MTLFPRPERVRGDFQTPDLEPRPRIRCPAGCLSGAAPLWLPTSTRVAHERGHPSLYPDSPRPTVTLLREHHYTTHNAPLRASRAPLFCCSCDTLVPAVTKAAWHEWHRPPGLQPCLPTVSTSVPGHLLTPFSQPPLSSGQSWGSSACPPPLCVLATCAFVARGGGYHCPSRRL